MSVAREHIAADRCAVAASVPLDWPGASNSRIAVAAGVQWHVQLLISEPKLGMPLVVKPLNYVELRWNERETNNTQTE